jgi:hypothetical protein
MSMHPAPTTWLFETHEGPLSYVREAANPAGYTVSNTISMADKHGLSLFGQQSLDIDSVELTVTGSWAETTQSIRDFHSEVA